uniref:Uncharacterized protein n=1 Tax=Anguilla anguilla TaxID=7936 RepID=A0A0E9P654_ANGAN
MSIFVSGHRKCGCPVIGWIWSRSHYEV